MSASAMEAGGKAGVGGGDGSGTETTGVQVGKTFSSGYRIVPRDESCQTHANPLSFTHRVSGMASPSPRIPVAIRAITTPLRSSAAPAIPPAAQLYGPRAKAVLHPPHSAVHRAPLSRLRYLPTRFNQLPLCRSLGGHGGGAVGRWCAPHVSSCYNLLFTFVTHLELFDEPWRLEPFPWSTFALLPAIMHLALFDLTDSAVSGLFSNCAKIEVLVSLKTIDLWMWNC
ncbi:hypothetical protein DFH09DRAFT_1303893 [Mycena vulgaris]|nr:hypothetical protein DFH09DRAFT_1303893 [Mycena vulgaris]